MQFNTYNHIDLQIFFDLKSKNYFTLQWLQTEALQNNPKIECTLDGKYIFKPVYKIKDKKSLLRLVSIKTF